MKKKDKAKLRLMTSFRFGSAMLCALVGLYEIDSEKKKFSFRFTSS